MVQQMIQKGQIYAEEFRGQLNERLPLAMRAMERATGLTTKEISKMMEEGKLGTEVLPAFGRELRKLANDGGALDKALKTVRVTENRFITQSQKAADKIFQSGFGAGLSELYQTMTSLLKDAGPQLEKIGRIFEVVFKGIAHIIRVVEEPLKLMIDNIEYLAGGYMIGKIATLGTALRTALFPITAAVLAAEELSSLMSDKLVGSLEKAAGRQFNVLEMTSNKFYEKDGKLYQGSTIEAHLGRKEGILEGFSRMLEERVVNPILGKENPYWYNTAQPTSRPANVTQYNTIQAPSEEVAYNTWKKLTEDAMSGR